MKAAVFSVDNWFLWSQVMVALFGVIAVVTGKLVADRESEKSSSLAKELLVLGKALEEQREKTAIAETARLKLEELIKNPRKPAHRNVLEYLRSKQDVPTDGLRSRTFTLAYVENDAEAYGIADWLYEAMYRSRPGGWAPSFPTTDLKGAIPRRGVTIVVPAWTNGQEIPEPHKTLVEAFKTSGAEFGGVFVTDKPMRPIMMPIMVIIGPKL